MIIKHIKELGHAIKKERKKQKLTQVDLALASGTGIRFISDLENGKETIEFEKAFHVLTMLGLQLELKHK